jgi:hypothetical protein
MAGLSQSAQQTALNAVFATSGSTDHIAYSEDGATETTALARTAIGATGWASATAATPSVKANNSALTSAAATDEAVITHAAVFSASSSGTQKTDWEALNSPKTLGVGDTITWDIGDVEVTLD